MSKVLNEDKGPSLSEIKFRSLFNNVLNGVFQSTPDGRFLTANPALVQLLGYSSENELKSVAIATIYANPEERKQWTEKLEQEGELRNAELRLRKKNGQEVVVLENARAVRDKNSGCVQYYEGTLTDITELKKTEEILREKELRLHFIVDQLPVIFWSTDTDLKITSSLGGALKALNMTPNMAVGTHLFEYLQTADPDNLPIAAHMKALKGESVSYMETWMGRDFRVRIEPLKTASGRVVGTAGFAHDITELKQAEKIQAALYRIAATTNSAEEMQDFYREIHGIIGELMYSRNFYIALYDETRQIYTFPYFVDEVDSAPGPLETLQKGLTEYVWRTGQPLLASPETFEDLVKAGEVHSVGAPSVDWLGVPLKKGEKTFGVLVVQSYTPTIRFGQKEKELLTFVSQHIATALERKWSQETLRESERRYRDMLENVELVSLLLDAVGQITFCNDYLLKLTGYRKDEVLGKNWFDLFLPEEERAHLKNSFTERVPHGMLTRHRENVILTRNGERRLILWNNTLLQDSNGAVSGTASIGIDITERRQAELDLERSFSLLMATLQSTADGILVVDNDGKITTFNQRFVEMWRIPDSVIALLDDNRALSFVLDQLKDPDGFIKKVKELYEQPDAESFDVLEFKDGRIFERYSLPQWIGGKCVGRVWSFSDITERRRAEEALRESEERYALAVRGANDGLWDWDLKKDTIYYSPRWKGMLGYPEEEISDSAEEWFQRVHPNDIDRLKAEIAAHLEVLAPHFENEHRIRHKDGSYRWVLSRALAVRNSEGRAYRLVGSQTDVTDRKIAEERLMHEAIHDVLTGLPNRALFTDLLGRSIGRAKRREDYQFAVLFLDLDRFKVINDSLGHMIGDELLVAFARRLEKTLRPGDTIARLGGDEFTILLDDIKEISDATRVAERIHEDLMQPFNLRGHEVFTTASIGIALSMTGYDRPEDVLRDADTAMYRAKARGKACHQVFDTAMHARVVAQLELETDLRRAVERQEFLLHYQPTVFLKTGKISGFEALLRWRHPERGLIFPTNFIPVIEETGLIVPIGLWVLREACVQLRAWKDTFGDGLTMSVNLSGKQIARPDLVDQIRNVLRQADIEPQDLIIEITESMLMENPEAAITTLSQLKEMKVGLQIDDFGTGYSSLSHLHRFPIDTLKIDRSFVSGMASYDDNLEMVRTIISLAHNLHLSLVAEGVESSQELIQLRALNCESGQGYYFSPPVSAFEAEALIASRRVW